MVYCKQTSNWHRTAPERARPRAQHRPQAEQGQDISARICSRTLLRPRTGALRRAPSKLFGLALAMLALPAGAADSKRHSDIEFDRDIRPIFSDNCYACHGPDEAKRKAGLRLDQQEGAFKQLKSGDFAIVPGDLEKSRLVYRISTGDLDDRMPPQKSGKHLTPVQTNLLARWVAEGAQWKQHWAFIKPERPALPVVQNRRWPRNPIDDFILARLEQAGLRPSGEAEKTALIRRLTFDLTGLPPTPEEVDAFLCDSSSNAYERVVDRLLASPRYGEHEAHYWLDAVRYGDTHGLHLDNERSLWPYRDWVVAAFNRNEPFNQFTIDQLAGDLEPNATLEEKIASGYNRCNVSTSEGGAIDEEFYVRYAVDRTETTSEVWMGLTVGCAVCHDHKYDPIKQKEFYQMYAFFNNMNEKAMDGNALLPPPMMKLPSPEQETQLAKLDKDIKSQQEHIKEEAAKIEYHEPEQQPKPLADKPSDYAWVEDDFPKGANVLKDGKNDLHWIEEASPKPAIAKSDQTGSGGADLSHRREAKADQAFPFSGKRCLTRTDSGLAQDFFTKAQYPLIVGKGDKLFAYVFLDPANPPKAIMLQYHTSDWMYRANWGDDDAIPFGEKGTSQKLLRGALPKTGEWVRLEVPAAELDLKPGAKVDGLAFTQFGGTVYWDHAGIVTATPQEDLSGTSQLAWEQLEKAREPSDLPKNLRDAIKLAPEKRSEAQKKHLREYYLANVYEAAKPVLAPLEKELASLKKQRDELDKAIPATMISDEMAKPRGAYILKRGEYDKRLDPVEPGVPAILPPLPPSEATNRLEFAKWLVSPDHPLTARVIVNRFWQQFFGTGIVKTSADFGNQSEWPSHPELLDWLATEFEGSGWDVKHMLRLIVTSATYRQRSNFTPQDLRIDPANRLLARGPRFRLDAEEIRDNALYVSGLLVETMGGHSVKPPQPEGIWEAVGYTTSNTAKFARDHGDAVHRRSLYTFWKRTAAPPYLTTFDAPSREKYCLRRERTDTPLQALVTMNDICYVEAARNLGERIIQHGGNDADARLDYAFRLVTARHPSASEKSVLEHALSKFCEKYEKDKPAAQQLIENSGDSPVAKDVNPSELAAYTMVASLLLNMDEVLNKN